MSYTNALINEKSAYLLQHAHDPVNWLPWGKEAFKKAKEEDKPIFLSIGYSSCHWCHVMARESFSDESVARQLNSDFVPIKVDREERPDIDGIYMRACQALTGTGGWPLNVFLSPDGRPFYAGTYFPKGNLLRLLEIFRDLWGKNREWIAKNGKKLTKIVRENMRNLPAREEAPIKEAVADFRQSFDQRYGGFGSAPKFPTPHNLMFLLRTAPEMAYKTLESMYRGGLFDHIGGGFSRYSTDRRWLVPHFEKMLYDNALLAMAYLLAYEESGEEKYRKVADRVFQYMERELRVAGEGFRSSQDADSEGEEGKFYLFSPDEIKSLLGAREGERFCARYGITGEGNFAGGSVANLLDAGEDDEAIEAFIPKVYEYRKRRRAPAMDPKQLTAWNALAAAAYACAGRILKEERYLKVARETIDFIGENLTDGVAMFSGISEGRRLGPAFLDDYAFYIFALILMHQATLEEKYLGRALELNDRAWDLFWDRDSGGFFFTGIEHEELIAHLKESVDGAMPSGNSVMAYNLSRLALLSGDEQLCKRAEMQKRYMNGEAAVYPMSYGFYLWASLPVKKVFCALADSADLRALRVRSDWAFKLVDGPDYPIVNGKTTYYVCEGDACRPPSNAI